MKMQEQDKYGAVEKCRAVLAVWTEKKKASVLCRELGVSATLLWQWQDRALSGILEALEPRGRRECAAGPALPPLVRRLLDRKVRSNELCSVGRSVSWRQRRSRSSAEGSPPAAS
jgi:transposase-like protein